MTRAKGRKMLKLAAATHDGIGFDTPAVDNPRLELLAGTIVDMWSTALQTGLEFDALLPGDWLRLKGWNEITEHQTQSIVSLQGVVEELRDWLAAMPVLTVTNPFAKVQGEVL
jgi:hypothetical protein